MPEYNGKDFGMGGTMRLGKRKTIFLTQNSILCNIYLFF